METKNKELYEAPATAVLDLKFEGVICQSDFGEGSIGPMGTPEDL
jgi:hypothetical protein